MIDSPAGPPNEDPDDIEVNFHKVDATLEIHEAYHRASNLNQIYVYKGEGMPDDDESDKHADAVPKIYIPELAWFHYPFVQMPDGTLA